MRYRALNVAYEADAEAQWWESNMNKPIYYVGNGAIDDEDDNDLEIVVRETTVRVTERPTANTKTHTFCFLH